MAFAKDKERLSVILTVRTTPSEKTELDAAAKVHGKEIADIVREGLDLWFAKFAKPRKGAK